MLSLLISGLSTLPTPWSIATYNIAHLAGVNPNGMAIDYYSNSLIGPAIITTFVMVAVLESILYLYTWLFLKGLALYEVLSLAFLTFTYGLSNLNLYQGVLLPMLFIALFALWLLPVIYLLIINLPNIIAVLALPASLANNVRLATFQNNFVTIWLYIGLIVLAFEKARQEQNAGNFFNVRHSVIDIPNYYRALVLNLYTYTSNNGHYTPEELTAIYREHNN
ncbi:hypothetical protein H7R52_14615 [Weissella confusa]|uniref:Uncharacterized protein n=1 Tax=Weissella confusa TaxID=1583 RepID=A0A923NIB7_WEICO|nr:hypothetical protein [Weissella confusa]